MKLGLLGHDRFLQRIIAAVIEEDHHTMFHSRYWSVFEDHARRESFPILIYLCPNNGCPFVHRRCLQLTKALRVPSLLLFPAHSTVRREFDHETLFHLVETPFYPLDLLQLVRQVIKRFYRVPSSRSDNGSPLQLAEQSPTWENEVELAPDLRFDRRANSLIRKGFHVNLSPREGRLLDILIQQQGRVVPFEDLFHSVWQDEESGSFDNLYVIVRSLKKKLRWDHQCFHHDLIQNVYGSGYRLRLPALAGEECSCDEIATHQE